MAKNNTFPDILWEEASICWWWYDGDGDDDSDDFYWPLRLLLVLSKKLVLKINTY